MLKREKIIKVCLLFALVAVAALLTFLLNRYRLIFFIGEEIHWMVVEIADSEKEMRRGLSGRGGMCRRCGMLFLFEKSGEYPFNMAGMRFGLDFVWIEKSFIKAINSNIPAEFDGQISAGSPVGSVVEINAGIAQNWRLEPGDRTIIFPFR